MKKELRASGSGAADPKVKAVADSASGKGCSQLPGSLCGCYLTGWKDKSD